MTEPTRLLLNAINREFCRTSADSFSNTRSKSCLAGVRSSIAAAMSPLLRGRVLNAREGLQLDKSLRHAVGEDLQVRHAVVVAG